jgi:hypothetical protein
MSCKTENQGSCIKISPSYNNHHDNRLLHFANTFGFFGLLGNKKNAHTTHFQNRSWANGTNGSLPTKAKIRMPSPPATWRI